MSTLHGAIEIIDTLLKEGERMSQVSLEKARLDVVDSNGKAANYATLCERVNSLGSALAQIKSKFTHISQEKAEIKKILDRLEKLEAQELQKFSSILLPN